MLPVCPLTLPTLRPVPPRTSAMPPALALGAGRAAGHAAASSSARNVAVRAVEVPSTPRTPAATGAVKTKMTLTEQILANRTSEGAVRPGDNVWVNVDKLLTHDVCGPGTFGVFENEFGANAKVHPRCCSPRRAATAAGRPRRDDSSAILAFGYGVGVRGVASSRNAGAGQPQAGSHLRHEFAARARAPPYPQPNKSVHHDLRLPGMFSGGCWGAAGRPRCCQSACLRLLSTNWSTSAHGAHSGIIVLAQFVAPLS